MTIPTRRFVVSIGAVVVLLVGSAAAATADTALGTAVIMSTFFLVAVGLASYVGASFAGEEQRNITEDSTIVAAARRGRLQGRHVTANEFHEAVGAGAGTSREIAEVLGVYEHVAHRMLASALAGGRVRLVGERVELAPTADAAPRKQKVAAAHWIEPEA